MAADPELDALRTLVASAGGRATIEPVSALAIALISPWAAERDGVKDRPTRRAPSDDRRLTEFLASARRTISTRPLPSDKGLLAWLRHTGRACPAADLGRAPTWLHSPYLAGAWVSLPPSGRYTPPTVDDSVIANDARVAFLHLLATQCAGGSDPTAIPRDAVLTLAEYFVGGRAAEWPQGPAEQCPRMRFNPQHAGTHHWIMTFQNLDPRPIRDYISRAIPIIHEGWQVPPPTPEQIAEEQQRQQVLAQFAIDDKAWRERKRRTANV